jgi:multidrug transporter EmrE-like cation transporter
LKYIYIGATILFTVYGQLILKWRISACGPLPDVLQEKIIFILRLLADWYVISGFFAAFVASLFWIMVMTKTELSFAYPIITAGLTLLTTGLAILLLGETISFPKVLGIILIICGIAVMQYN